jgi:YggT family protein
MMHLPGDTDRMTTTTGRTYATRVFVMREETLRRITLLIQLAFGVLNSVIGLRFLLKVVGANPANPFANLIYTFTTPFLWMFQGLTRTPSYQGIEVELFALVAIVVYTLIAWVIVQVLWILFARLK